MIAGSPSKSEYVVNLLSEFDQVTLKAGIVKLINDNRSSRVSSAI